MTKIGLWYGANDTGEFYKTKSEPSDAVLQKSHGEKNWSLTYKKEKLEKKGALEELVAFLNKNSDDEYHVHYSSVWTDVDNGKNGLLKLTSNRLFPVSEISKKKTESRHTLDHILEMFASEDGECMIGRLDGKTSYFIIINGKLVKTEVNKNRICTFRSQENALKYLRESTGKTFGLDLRYENNLKGHLKSLTTILVENKEEKSQLRASEPYKHTGLFDF